MRCLIPVHQEYYPKNALNRAKLLCDEPVILYILDVKMLEKFRDEVSYALPSQAIDEMERFLVDTRKKEAMKLKEKYGYELKFITDEYYKGIEKTILKERFDLIMCDKLQRRFLTYSIPVWIDKGDGIGHIGVYVRDVTRIKQMKSILKFIHTIAERLGADVCIVPRSTDVSRILKEKMCHASPDALAIQKKYYREKKSWEGTLVLI